MWAQPTGTSQNGTAPNVGQLFFPQTRALGIDCGHYSPAVLRMIVYAGTKHPSFAQGSEALANWPVCRSLRSKLSGSRGELAKGVLRNATAMSTPIFVFR